MCPREGLARGQTESSLVAHSKGGESSDTGSWSHAGKKKISFLSFLWPPDFPELGLKTGIQATWLLCRGVRQLWERLPRAISRALSSSAIIQSARTHPTLSQKQEAQMLETGRESRPSQTLVKQLRQGGEGQGSCRNILPLMDWAIRSSETHRRALGMKAPLKKS